MGIESDIKEYASEWKKKPLFLKVIYAIPIVITFLSLGSISSLSFEFTSFLMKGITFYRQITTIILKHLNIYFSLNITQEKFGFIAIYLVFFGAAAKLYVMPLASTHPMLIGKANLWLTHILVTALFIYFILTFDVSNLVVLAFALYLPFLPFVGVLLSNRFPLHATNKSTIILNREKEQLRHAKQVVYYIFGVYLCFLVVAAIVEGPQEQLVDIEYDSE